MTLDTLDIESGKGRLWPVRINKLNNYERDIEYFIEGEEYWMGENDDNLYAHVYTLAVAERIVKLWNANIGIPTKDIPNV